MTTLNRIVVAWTGNGVVGAAVNVLHFSASDNSAPNVAGILSAYQDLNPVIPSGCKITVPGTGDKIDDTTGELVGTWAAAGGGTVLGQFETKVAAGVGACVGWQTGGIVRGRRLRGRTFLVPLASTLYDTDGTLGTSQVAQVTSWATKMIASGPLAVWSRPTGPGLADGNSYGVLSAKVRDKVAFLSSRRD